MEVGVVNKIIKRSIKCSAFFIACLNAGIGGSKQGGLSDVKKTRYVQPVMTYLDNRPGEYKITHHNPLLKVATIQVTLKDPQTGVTYYRTFESYKKPKKLLEKRRDGTFKLVEKKSKRRRSKEKKKGKEPE